MSFINTLNEVEKKINDIVEKKEDELEKEEYKDYKYVFDATIKIIKNMKVLLYGGTAINEILPDNLKIYGEYTLPDIDMFTTNALSKANYIAKKLEKQGFKAVSVSEAYHKNTFKVFAEGLQILDITEVSKKAFNKLSMNSKKGSNGIPIVNIDFLRLTLHLLLSQSNDAHRWGKVFKRLVLFYKEYPPNTHCAIREYKFSSRSSMSDERKSLIIGNVYMYLEKSEFVLFGPSEVKFILEQKRDILNLDIYDIHPQVFLLVNTNNLREVAINMIKKLSISGSGINDFSISKIYRNNYFIHDHIIIKYKNESLIVLFKAEACMTYNTYNNYRIATINTIVRLYLSIILSGDSKFYKYTKILECAANQLAQYQQKYKTSRNVLLQNFVTQCYGEYESLQTLRRNRILRIKGEKDKEAKAKKDNLEKL
jgi:hypothetical protein